MSKQVVEIMKMVDTPVVGKRITVVTYSKKSILMTSEVIRYAYLLNGEVTVETQNSIYHHTPRDGETICDVIIPSPDYNVKRTFKELLYFHNKQRRRNEYDGLQL